MNRYLLAAAGSLSLVGGTQASAMELSSLSWQSGGQIGSRYAYDQAGCAGGNVSPQVSWRDAPAATRSYVISVFDPDAPGGAGWWHWVVLDIPPEVKQLREGAGNSRHDLPAGAMMARSDFGAADYGGPCPPAGTTHRYVLTVRAIDVAKIAAPRQPESLGAVLRGHVLATASLTARYRR